MKKSSIIDTFKKGDKFTSWGFEFQVIQKKKSLIMPGKVHIFAKSLIEAGTLFKDYPFEFSEAMLLNATR